MSKIGCNFLNSPNMNLKRNITFQLESRKKDGVLVTENVPIRMRIVFDGKRIEFTTGYRIDAAKWDASKQRGYEDNCLLQVFQNLYALSYSQPIESAA